MKTYLALLYADILTVKRWFITKTVSKILVMLLFLLLFYGIARGIGGVSGIFFRLLASYESFGLLTAGYVIHAAIFITFLLSVASSCVAAFGFLLAPGASIRYMYTLPVDFSRVAIWLFLKTVIGNMLLMAFVYLPVMWSFARAFDMISFGFLLEVLSVLFFLVAVSVSVGIGISLFFSRGGMVTGFFVFFLTIVGAMKLIFPPQIQLLYEASPVEFAKIFSSLPLNHIWMPGYWLSKILIGEGTLLAVVMLMVLMLITVFLSLNLWKKHMQSQLQKIFSRSFQSQQKKYTVHFFTIRHPVVLAEVLGVQRDPKEVGYGIFLLALSLFFFTALGVLGMEGRWITYRSVLTIFTYAWFLFFTTAVLLRFVFPSMSREGKRFWYLFSLPISRSTIVSHKFRFAGLFLIPLILLSGAISAFMPFMSGIRLFMLVFCVLSSIMLVIVHSGVGVLFPNFEDGDDPERVSTTFGGLFAFFLSIGVAVWSGWQLYSVLQLPSNIPYALIALCVVYGSFAGILWLLSKRAIESYEQ